MVWSQYSILNIVIHGAQTPKYKNCLCCSSARMLSWSQQAVPPFSSSWNAQQQSIIFVREKLLIFSLILKFCITERWIILTIYYFVENWKNQKELKRKDSISLRRALPCSTFLPEAKVGKISDQQDHLFQTDETQTNWFWENCLQ